MPKRGKLLDELGRENYYGILLAAQMGGAPNELQVIVQTLEYDAAVKGLRERSGYVIRALGVREHRLVLGAFKSLALLESHPLLYPHNMPSVGVFFRGSPTGNVYELMLDIFQVHGSVFGLWRNLAEDLNHAAPLHTLLTSGGGLLGEMPQPAAEKIEQALAQHGLETKLIADPSFSETDEHGRSRLAQLLLIDQGYVVALDFSVEELGKV